MSISRITKYTPHFRRDCRDSRIAHSWGKRGPASKQRIRAIFDGRKKKRKKIIKKGGVSGIIILGGREKKKKKNEKYGLAISYRLTAEKIKKESKPQELDRFRFRALCANVGHFATGTWNRDVYGGL